MAEDTIPASFTLGEFEGKPVVGAAVEVRGVAGGLNDALGVDPVVLTQGEHVVVAFECTVAQIRHEAKKGEPEDGEQIRVHVLKAAGAVIAEGDLVDKISAAISSQSERVEAAAAERDAREAIEKQRAKDAESGQMRIDDAVESEKVELPDPLDAPPAAGSASDEVGAKRAERAKAPAKTGTAKQVTPRPKKTTGAKKATH